MDNRTKEFLASIAKLDKQFMEYLEYAITFAEARVLPLEKNINFNNPKEWIKSENLLLLRKVYVHMLAIKIANNQKLIHPFALHMRIILECIARITRNMELHGRDKKKILSKKLLGSINEFNDLVNKCQMGKDKNMQNMERKHIKKVEYLDIFKDLMNKHQIDANENMQNMGREDLKKVADYVASHLNHGIKIEDIFKHLEYGENYHKHLSRCFVHPNIEKNLFSDAQYFGSVKALPIHVNLASIIRLFDYLIHQILVMMLIITLLDEGDKNRAEEIGAMLKDKKTKYVVEYL